MANGPARNGHSFQLGAFHAFLRVGSEPHHDAGADWPSSDHQGHDRMHTNTPTRMLVLIPAALVAAACAVEPTTAVRSITPDQPAAFDAVKFWEAGATVAWNATATSLTATRVSDATRLYAYLSLAQLRAAEAANAAPGPHPPVSAAIGGAS